MGAMVGVEMVEVREAASKSGYSVSWVRRLVALGLVQGVTLPPKARGRGRVVVDIVGLLAYKTSPELAERKRRHGAEKRGAGKRKRAEHELVCLGCIIPGDCRPGDFRCKYHFPDEKE